MTLRNAWAAGTPVALGVNHHTAPLEVRERLALNGVLLRGMLPHVPHVLLATCNRSEVYLWDSGPGATISNQLARAFGEVAGLRMRDLRPYLFVTRGAHAILHMVRVATGLDSMVIGEEQILGQLRLALRVAVESGTSGPALDGVIGRVIAAARRIRAATLPERRSLAAAAIGAVRTMPEMGPFGLVGRQAIVLGAGSMAKSASQTLVAAGAQVSIVNRTFEHAARLANDLGHGACAADMEMLAELLMKGSVVVAATRAERPVLDEATVRAAIAGRDGRPLVLVDVSVPRNIEPSVRAIPHTCLIDLDDLERLCPVDLATRRSEIQRAEMMAGQAAQAITSWLRVRAISPVISDLRKQADEIRCLELRRAAQRLAGLTPEQHSAVAHLTEAIVNKLLHGPTVALRQAAEGSATPDASQRVVEVLRLDRARRIRHAHAAARPDVG